MIAIGLLFYIATELAFIVAAWELGNEIEARAWARIGGMGLGLKDTGRADLAARRSK